MKKYLIVVLVIFCIGVIWYRNVENSSKEQKNNEEINAIITDYAEQTQRPFVSAPIEIEKQLYGVWQAKEYAGYRRSTRYQWDGLWGNIIIFGENTFIYDNISYTHPVFAYYESSAEDLEMDEYLELEWTDERYTGLNGLVIAVLNSEKDGKFVWGMPYQFIMMEDRLIIERGGSYFGLVKVGDIKPYHSDNTYLNEMNLTEQIESVDSVQSKSERYCNESVKNLIESYETEYHHLFVPATSQMETYLHGIWQIKKCVGETEPSDFSDRKVVSDIIVFCENAWILNGIPSFQPVYYYYESCVEDLEKSVLSDNLKWEDNEYKKMKGKVIIGIQTEKNESFGSSHGLSEPIKLIMIENVLMIEDEGKYYELEKIGEVEMNDMFSNVKPH